MGIFWLTTLFQKHFFRCLSTVFTAKWVQNQKIMWSLSQLLQTSYFRPSLHRRLDWHNSSACILKVSLGWWNSPLCQQCYSTSAERRKVSAVAGHFAEGIWRPLSSFQSAAMVRCNVFPECPLNSEQSCYNVLTCAGSCCQSSKCSHWIGRLAGMTSERRLRWKMCLEGQKK